MQFVFQTRPPIDPTLVNQPSYQFGEVDVSKLNKLHLAIGLRYEFWRKPSRIGKFIVMRSYDVSKWITCVLRVFGLVQKPKLP